MGMDEEPKTRRRARRSQPGRDLEDPGALDELLVAHSRNAMTDLPRGVLGTSTAADLLRVLPEASRLGLPDLTGYGSEVFTTLVEHGLLPALPSPRVVPAALALAARVSPLVEARSARTWTLWVARVRAPGSAVARAVQAVTPSSDIAVVPVTLPSKARRAAASPDEPNHAAVQLAQVRDELAEIRRLVGVADTDDRPTLEVLKPIVTMRNVAAASPDEPQLAQLRDELAAIRRLVGIADTDDRPTLEVLKPIVSNIAAASPDEPNHAAVQLAQLRDELAAIRRLVGLTDTDDRPTLEVLEEVIKPFVSRMSALAQQVRAVEDELAHLHAEHASVLQRAEAAERDLEVARAGLAKIGITLADLIPLVVPTVVQEERPDAPSSGANALSPDVYEDSPPQSHDQPIEHDEQHGRVEGRYYRRALRTDGQPTYWQRLFPGLPPEESPSRWPGRKPTDKG